MKVGMKESLALVHGNFEILHTGHARLFAYAKSLADKLVVGLYVEGIAFDEIERRRNLLLKNSLVDEIVEFTEINILLKKVKPRILVKGREFKERENYEEAILGDYGGRIIFTSGEEHSPDSERFIKAISPSNLMTDQIKDFIRRNRITKSVLIDAVNLCGQKRTLVVGDLILDEYIDCYAVGLSQETASIVAKPTGMKKFLGGAGIVAAHCAALGSQTSLLTIVGEDQPGTEANGFLRNFGVTPNFVVDEDHITVLKQRFVSSGQTIFRLNHYRSGSVKKKSQNLLLEKFKEIISNIEVLIFSDFSYGVLDSDTTRMMISMAKERNVYISSDSQTSSQNGDLKKFRGTKVVCPTEREERQEVREPEGLIVISQRLSELLMSEVIFLKLGAEGLLINGVGLKTEHIPALNSQPKDVAGAGDSLLAVSSLSMANKLHPYVSGLVGSVAAAIQVSRIGNVPVTRSELINQIQSMDFQ